MVSLPTEGVIGVQFYTLDEGEPVRAVKAFNGRNFVMVGDAEKVIALLYIAIQSFLGGNTAIGVGRVAMQVAL
jgi:hypothetical protein